MAGDWESNKTFKRGIVRENDAKNARSRVEFVDEDGTVSRWLDWNMPAAGASKFYAAPDVGSQVHCVLDHHGEDGTIIGARYSKEDRPPASNDKHMKGLWEGGLDLEYDKTTGAVTINSPKSITFICGDTRIEITPGQFKVTSADYEFV